MEPGWSVQSFAPDNHRVATRYSAPPVTTTSAQQAFTQVLAAAGVPVAAPNDAPLPSEIGIRPGAWMLSPSGCTMNFIFTRNGQYAIGTAGHCVDKVGDHVVHVDHAVPRHPAPPVERIAPRPQHRPGRDRVHGDALLGHFQRHRLGKAGDAVLGGDVGRFVGRGDQRVRRGDVDDAPPAPLPHRGKR